jgi:hypothetical protein
MGFCVLHPGRTAPEPGVSNAPVATCFRAYPLRRRKFVEPEMPTQNPENPLIAMIHLATRFILASAMVGGCSVALVLRAIKTAKDRRDSNRIYQFLCRNFKDGQYTFRSSEAISAYTNLPVSRIADLCGKHAHIESKDQERHTWRALPRT